MKMMSVVLVFLVGLLAVGCTCPPQVEKILRGEHKLRKMTERMDVNSGISGGFFLFAGSLSGSTETTASVKFAWEMSDGTYAISSLPLEKIRVKLDEKAIVPTIKFNWEELGLYGSGSQAMEIQNLMDRHVHYAVVTIRESDWPVQVNLPLNQ